MRMAAINVLDVAYSDSPSLLEWLQNLHVALIPALNTGDGVHVFCYELIGGRPRVMAHVTDYGESHETLLMRSLAEAPSSAVHGVFGISCVNSLSEIVPNSLDEPYITGLLKPLGAVDSVGFSYLLSSGLGIGVGALHSAKAATSPAFRRLWLCLAAHIGAALRLRIGDPPDVEAVLDPSGRICDATGRARSLDARIALRHAARAIDRSRCARRLGAMEAVEAWRVLVDGQWSLVDRFDSDGRHFILARRNSIATSSRASGALSRREAQAAALAALGRPNKLIAYELGISVGTVGTLLARAAHKLCVGSRAQLIREWLRLQSEDVSNINSSQEEAT